MFLLRACLTRRLKLCYLSLFLLLATTLILGALKLAWGVWFGISIEYGIVGGFVLIALFFYTLGMQEIKAKKQARIQSFWISWYHKKTFSDFEYNGPWWISSKTMNDERSICAAVRARSADAAKKIVMHGIYDEPPYGIEWRFVEARPDDWSPFSDRFPRADFMEWGE